ncbi:MAG: hypothetical protein A3F10_05930 [Coxiella sp. RIFCSPHIGHO2_12_FULL_42_15]|nr:MAG: hypothetical protein A3F10_05930 [Coxiella sp. RIFCSPHIGHO2_12_FULL_42_15]
MTTEIHVYSDAATPLQGYLSYENAKSPKPAVLICPDWTGRNAFADQQANAFAKRGYVGFAIDIYGNGQQGKDNDEKSALMQPFMKNRAMLRQRLLAAFNSVKELDVVDSKRIAIIGFCFGGLCALDLARSGADIKGAVSFHGLLHRPSNLPNETITTKVLALHGYDDPMVTPADVNAFAEEMTTAQVDWQVHLYGNTKHAFTNPLANDPTFGTVYNEVAANRSFYTMHHFLQEIFQ